MISKTPAELQNVERGVFMEIVKTQILWTFELETQERINIPIWIFVGFQQRDRQDSKNLNNETFYRPLLTSVQCITGTEKYPNSAILLNSDDDDDYSQGYAQNIEAFRALTKADILKAYISDKDFTSPNNNYNDLGY